MRGRRAVNQRRAVTRRRAGLAAIAVVGLGLGLALPAWAASSGYVLQQTTYEYAGNVNFCGESSIVATADNRSYALSDDAGAPCSTSSNTWTAPSGFLGVNAQAYYDGAFCGETGDYFNENATYNFGVGEAICGDEGCGEYFTHATQGFWSVSQNTYLSGKEDSPQVSYYC